MQNLMGNDPIRPNCQNFATSLNKGAITNEAKSEVMAWNLNFFKFIFPQLLRICSDLSLRTICIETQTNYYKEGQILHSPVNIYLIPSIFLIAAFVNCIAEDINSIFALFAVIRVLFLIGKLETTCK